MKQIILILILLNVLLYSQQTTGNELTDYEKIELRAAELEYDKEELEKKIFDITEKYETEKILLKGYESELERLNSEYNVLSGEIHNGQNELNLSGYVPITKKNELEAGATSFINFDNAEKKLFRTGFTIPRLDYKYEKMPYNFFRMYLYSGSGYQAVRSVWDREHRTDPEDNLEHRTDTFSHDVFFYLNPMLKFYFPGSMFIKGGLPFNYSEFRKQFYNADAYGIMSLDMRLDLGFDNRNIEMSLLTPWNNFEDGFALFGFFKPNLMTSSDGKSPEELPMYLGMEAYYSKILKSHDMIKAYFKHSYQINENAADRNTWITAGAIYAKDINSGLNSETDFSFEVDEREFSEKYDISDQNDDVGTFFNINLRSKLNYYFIPVPVLNLFGGVNMSYDLTRDEDQLGDYMGSVTIGFEAGITYKLSRMESK